MDDPKYIKLNKYKIVGLIGEGAFSRVYKIKEIVNGELFAAKILKKEINEDSIKKEEALLLFREVKVMASLNHPSILTFIGYSPINFDRLPFPTIITKYAPNQSLREILELESKSLSPEWWNDTRKLITIYGIASGILYLHKNNIIHRDMKPENILMDEYFFPQIADFGFAKIVSNASNSINIQSQDGFKGTPIYMAPEILRNKDYSKPVDVYAFSIIVYEIMTGTIPFSNLSLPQIVFKVGEGSRPELTEDIPEVYKDLIQNCWAQDPAQRLTFEQIINELKTNRDFITATIDENEYYNFVDFIDDYKTSFIMNNSFHFEDFIHKKGRNSSITKVNLASYLESIASKEKIQSIASKEKVQSINQKEEANLKTPIEKTQPIVTKVKAQSTSQQDEKQSLLGWVFKGIISFFKTEPEKEVIDISYPVDEFYNLDYDCQDMVNRAYDNPELQFVVGRNLILGEKNFPKNVLLGVKYLKKSISEHNVDSLLYLCDMLIKGDVIPQDLGEAKKYLKQYLNQQNDPSVLFVYGKICMIEKNYSDAKNSFEKAAKSGHYEAMYILGKMLYKGKGCQMNHPEAIRYFQLSKNEYEKSQNFLDVCDNASQINEFNSLSNEIQQVIVMIMHKTENTYIFDNIYMKAKNIEILHSYGAFESYNFLKFLQNFNNIIIDILYPSKVFSSLKKFISDFEKMSKANIQLNAFVSSEVITIECYAFSGCSSLTNIEIPSSVTIIDDFALSGCSSLAQLTIPFSVTQIGNNAFGGCSLITQLSIPSSVVLIKSFAFCGCSSIECVSIPNSVKSIGESAFSACLSLKQVTLPSSITKIENSTFNRCPSLIQITIPTSVTLIGDNVFEGCSSLEEITIPSSVTSIGNSTFSRCTSLKMISIPYSVTTIGDSIFSWCSSITHISIPSSLQLRSNIGINNNVIITTFN